MIKKFLTALAVCLILSSATALIGSIFQVLPASAGFAGAVVLFLSLLWMEDAYTT